MEYLPLIVTAFVIYTLIIFAVMLTRDNDTRDMVSERRDKGQENYRTLFRGLRTLGSRLGFDVEDTGWVAVGERGYDDTPISQREHVQLMRRVLDLEAYLKIKYVTKPGTETKQVYEKIK